MWPELSPVAPTRDGAILETLLYFQFFRNFVRNFLIIFLNLQCSRMASDEIAHPFLGLSVFGIGDGLFTFKIADNEPPRSLDGTPVLSCQIEELSIRLTHFTYLYFVVHIRQVPT